ncbi:hypothetical protein B0T24DRAFT_724336 [Lasiosphaeria ovina]|uniref:Rhodopsin domain-containing protein n=1 Tax=Lasiosphaeria ovina TaxID=92902 RepID=A0AAE0JU54_9PEZI|nr:hypothetical protein B0T24DRAFT_724336 [Lasiosphaeria ovina]
MGYYDDPAGLIAASVIMELLAVACVSLRFYSRSWKGQVFIASDWVILVALIFATGLTAMEIYGKRLTPYIVIELSYMLLGVATTGLVKFSVCLLYWRLFARVMFRRFLAAWCVVIVCWTVAFLLAGLLECGSQLSALFSSPQVYYQYCGSAVPAGYGMIASDLATDLITLVIPVPVILTLVMDTRTKVLTLLTFMIGAFSVGASIAKAYIYIEVALGSSTQDAILSLTAISIWNLVEVQVGIMAACGPTLRVILSHLLPTDAFMSLISSMGRSHRSTKGSTKLSNIGEGPSTAESLHFPMKTMSKAPSERSGGAGQHWESDTRALRPHGQV